VLLIDSKVMQDLDKLIAEEEKPKCKFTIPQIYLTIHT
jgi:hypothetical protein